MQRVRGEQGGCTKAGERFWPPSLIFDDVMISDGALTGSIPVVMKIIREDINEKKTFSFGHCPNEGGGSTHARIFWPFFKKCIFGQ